MDSPYSIRFSKQAARDVLNLSSKLQEKALNMIEHGIATNPYQGKKLVGKLRGLYSMRLTIQDRILYRIQEDIRTVEIIRAKTHYGE